MTELYRELVRMTVNSQKHFTALVMHGNQNHNIKYGTWLHLMGLIETWDIVVWTRRDQDK